VTSGKSDTSQRVRDAAVDLFATRGYDGTSMRDIARHVGISVANLYNYTDGKESLYWTVMKATISELMDEQRDALATEACPAARFAAFAYTHARYHTHRAKEVRLGNTPLESLSPERATKVRSIRDEYEGMFRVLIRDGAGAGYLTTPEPELASRAILQMGVGISLWFRPDAPLTSDYVGRVYAAFALAIAGFDEAAHGERCAEVDCSAVAAWANSAARAGALTGELPGAPA